MRIFCLARLGFVLPFFLGTSAYSNDTLYFRAKVLPILQPTCFCHFKGEPDLQFFDTTKYALGLKGLVSSKYYLDDTVFVPFFTPGRLDSSMLYIKPAYIPVNEVVYLTGDAAGERIQSGARMPAGKAPLNPKQLETIGKWILLAGGVDTNTYKPPPLPPSSVQPGSMAFSRHGKGAGIFLGPPPANSDGLVFGMDGRLLGWQGVHHHFPLRPNVLVISNREKNENAKN